MFYLLIAVFLLILILELPGLVKRKRVRDLMAFLLVYSICIYLGLAQFFDWPMYIPLKAGADFLSNNVF